MAVFVFIQILIEYSVKKSGDPDQTPRSAASGLVLHCLPMSHKKDARLIWVKYQKVSEYDQVMPRSHTANKPTAPKGRDTEH